MAANMLWVLCALFAGCTSLYPTLNHPKYAGLGAQLSKGAEVFLPGSSGYTNATTRWSAAVRPDLDAVVKVRTEEDIQKVIRHANQHNQPFLVISGGHGTTSILSNVRNGIGIWMRGMNHVSIVDNGKAAIVGGGIQTGELIPALWDQGKQTVTTGCDCVGYIAPTLGGGHGWLQGRYGLATDNLLSARIVLANGTAITVSDDENKDLFWAVRGAGVNFGIYPEIKIRIYDRTLEQDQWAASMFTFTHDKLERVFSIANEWLESPNRPVELMHYGVFAFNHDVDTIMPVVNFLVLWQGNSSIPAAFADPLNALEPVNVDASVTDLAGVNTHLGASYNMAACAEGYSRVLTPVSLNSWPISNLRTTLELFAEMPPAFNSSVVMLEAFATNRVIQIPDKSTAYPDRSGQLLLSPLLTYAADRSLDQTAYRIGKRMREALLNNTGKPLIAYVNYATGDENQEAIYGYESWRLRELRRLKVKYDPLGKFNFYAPIKIPRHQDGL